MNTQVGLQAKLRNRKWVADEQALYRFTPVVAGGKVLYNRADKKHGLSDMAYSTVTLMLDGRAQIRIWTKKSELMDAIY